MNFWKIRKNIDRFLSLATKTFRSKIISYFAVGISKKLKLSFSESDSWKPRRNSKMAEETQVLCVYFLWRHCRSLSAKKSLMWKIVKPKFAIINGGWDTHESWREQVNSYQKCNYLHKNMLFTANIKVVSEKIETFKKMLYIYILHFVLFYTFYILNMNQCVMYFS